MPTSRLLLLAGLLLAAATTHAQTTAPALPTLAQRYQVATTPKAEAKPLYVVDGIALDTPFLPDTLAPEDIAGISIFKNGDAAVAQYGPRAANGVVVVTTKQGGKR